MKFANPLIVVSDMEKSKLFYSEVLGLDVDLDLGENVTLTGGIVNCILKKMILMTLY